MADTTRTPSEAAQLDLEKESKPFLDADVTPLQDLLPKHDKFLRLMIGFKNKLPAAFSKLDASHPFMVFWAINSLIILKQPVSNDEIERLGKTIIACQHKDGGFGGGPGQPGHIASTYAAVMALAYTGDTFYSQIEREKLADWVLRELKTSDCGFRVSRHGEVDPRAAYCALAATTLLGVCTPAIRSGVGEYLQKCQTYEGGFANIPFGEAHGGYTFCSVAALMMLNPQNPLEGVQKYCDVHRLERWLINRQDIEVPGFQGRTNKLVDGCYSQWIGGCWPLLEQLRPDHTGIWDRNGLRNYILKCCQHPNGGLRDKVGFRSDSYHTNYCLTGLSSTEYRYRMIHNNIFKWSAESIVKDNSNITPLNPIFGITFDAVEKVQKYLETNGMRLHAAPSSREYQGFAIYVGATLVLILYIVWAFLPARWLHAAHIDYYPSRWWAVAVPSFILMLMVYIYVLLASYNTEVLTFKPDSLSTVCDKDSSVHDVSIVEVNKKYLRRRK